MSATRLASRYAKSLIDFSIEQKQMEEVSQDVHMLDDAIEGNREFALMLKSPIISGDKKMKVVLAVFQGKITEITINFIEILMRKNRESYLHDIINSFIVLYNEKKGITPVKITTAQPISPELQDQIIEKLKKEGHFTSVKLTTAINESLIGGYVLEFDNKQIDASIARGLAILKDDFDNNDYVRKF